MYIVIHTVILFMFMKKDLQGCLDYFQETEMFLYISVTWKVLLKWHSKTSEISQVCGEDYNLSAIL